MAFRPNGGQGGVTRITEYGAVADGSETTEAIQATIDAVADAGGGVACVPPGEYVTGTIKLRDGVTLHVETGATLRGSTDRDHYGTDELTADFFWDVEDREGWHEAVAPLLVADGAADIGLTGGGRIDGRAESFWTVEDSPTDDHFVPDDRPGMMIRFTRCTGVKVRDVRIENSPGWTLHLRGCEDVSVHDVRIHNSVYGPNTDGIDVDACHHVRISDSEIMAGGDDAIVLKNVLKGLHEYPDCPSQNITVTNCELISTTNAFKIGTENYEGFGQVTLSNSVLRTPVPERDYEVDDRFGETTGPYAGIALETVDGATLDGIAISNVVMRGAQAPFFLRVGNRPRYRRDHPELPDQEPLEPGSLRNVSIANVVATDARIPSPIAGVPDGPIEDVSLADVRIETTGGETDPSVLDRSVPEGADEYPEATQWGTLPVYGFYCRHVDGLTMTNLSVDLEAGDSRPLLLLDDTRNVRIDGVSGDAPIGDRPLVGLIDVRTALLRGLGTSEDAGTVVGIEGSDSRRIAITGSDLWAATDPVKTTDEVSETAVERR